MKKKIEGAKQRLIHQQKIEIRCHKQLLIAGKNGRVKVKGKMKYDDAEPSVQLDCDRKLE